MAAGIGAAERDVGGGGAAQPTISYNAGISACGKGGQWQQALALLSEIWEAKLHPDVCPSQLQCRDQRVREGRAVAAGIGAAQRDVGSKAAARLGYSAGISACGKGDQWQRASALLNEMREAKLQPSVISYSAGIRACETDGQWQRALALLGQILEAKLQLDVLSCNAGIRACGKGDRWQQALALLDEMREAKLEPNVFPTMPASARASRVRSGSGLWRCSARCGRRRWSPTSSLYSSGISACEKGEQWQRALALLGDIWGAKLVPNVFSYSAGISACEKGGQWQSALALLGEMRQASLQPNGFSYSAGISACGKGDQWERALALLSEMWGAKLEPSVTRLQRWDQRVREGQAVAAGFGAAERVAGGEAGAKLSYNAGISACEKGEQWQRALALLSEMREARLEPNVISYNAELCACERCGQWRQALSLLDEMRAIHLKPDDLSYNMGVAAYEKSSRNLAGFPGYVGIGLSR
ncbi:unnamed protein product [Prorocentrum cordatum]|uniref:Pentatricopeptide repeat-containing protein, chloroplastic n=1 Tax=Prorocentrum cordatum TaxID=2364126 RepID=A0ABN9PS49_9DINO|nr:unnamed protein product [Polarella glacialis]